MADNILISVFTFNVENFIESLFIDLKKFGHLNKEIICLNNNSSDNTVKLINKLKLKMKIPNLKIISHSTNMGYGYNKKISFDYAINNLDPNEKSYYHYTKGTTDANGLATTLTQSTNKKAS